MYVFVGVCQIVCVCPSLPFGIEGRMWVVTVLIPDHFLSIYFKSHPGQHIFQTKSIARTVFYPVSNISQFRTAASLTRIPDTETDT